MNIQKTLLDAGKMLWLPALVVAAWWVLSGTSENFYFPPLSKIFDKIIFQATEGALWENVLFSMINFIIGFVVAGIAGILFGILLGSLRRVRVAVSPLLDFMRSMPQIALVPVVIMAFGIGPQPKAFLIGFICFWPILLNTIDGVRGLNPQLLEVAKAYRIPYPVYLMRMVLPATLPTIMAGMRIAIGLGVVMMVVSEMYSSTRGIGFYILQSQESYRITDVWAGTIVIGLLGYLISVGFVAVERYLLAWYYQVERRGLRRWPPNTAAKNAAAPPVRNPVGERLKEELTADKDSEVVVATRKGV